MTLWSYWLYNTRFLSIYYRFLSYKDVRVKYKLFYKIITEKYSLTVMKIRLEIATIKALFSKT